MEMITNAHIIGLLAAISIFFFGAVVGIYLKEILDYSWSKKKEEIQNDAAEDAEYMIKREAVRSGHAEWVVNQDGLSTFHWLEPHTNQQTTIDVDCAILGTEDLVDK